MTICCSSFSNSTQDSIEFVPKKEYNINDLEGYYGIFNF